MKTFAMFVAILASATFVAEAVAQTPVPPPAGQSSRPLGNAVEGRIESVDSSRTEITLTDGTKLVMPSGSVLRPGVVTEGMIVVASYREENGAKVLTGLAVKDRGPATR